MGDPNFTNWQNMLSLLQAANYANNQMAMHSVAANLALQTQMNMTPAGAMSQRAVLERQLLAQASLGMMGAGGMGGLNGMIPAPLLAQVMAAQQAQMIANSNSAANSIAQACRNQANPTPPVPGLIRHRMPHTGDVTHGVGGNVEEFFNTWTTDNEQDARDPATNHKQLFGDDEFGHWVAAEEERSKRGDLDTEMTVPAEVAPNSSAPTIPVLVRKSSGHSSARMPFSLTPGNPLEATQAAGSAAMTSKVLTAAHASSKSSVGTPERGQRRSELKRKSVDEGVLDEFSAGNRLSEASDDLDHVVDKWIQEEDTLTELLSCPVDLAPMPSGFASIPPAGNKNSGLGTYMAPSSAAVNQRAVPDLLNRFLHMSGTLSHGIPVDRRLHLDPAQSGRRRAVHGPPRPLEPADTTMGPPMTGNLSGTGNVHPILAHCSSSPLDVEKTLIVAKSEAVPDDGPCRSALAQSKTEIETEAELGPFGPYNPPSRVDSSSTREPEVEKDIFEGKQVVMVRGKYKGKNAFVQRKVNKKYRLQVEGVAWGLEFYPNMFDLPSGAL